MTGSTLKVEKEVCKICVTESCVFQNTLPQDHFWLFTWISCQQTINFILGLEQ